jgi:hypothetical protein
MNPENKNCQNCKKDFVIESEDFNFYKKIDVPSPTFCPECRLIRRLMYRNERTFYHRVCEKCNKKIIAVFSESTGIHVYCQSCWWGDEWDAQDYREEYDPNRSFIEQVYELLHRVPIMNLFGLHTTNVGTEYANMTGWLKNCYMVTYSDHSENLIYGSFVNWSKDSIDNLMGQKLELCYETINCTQCYKTFFSTDCVSCNNVWFSKNCVGCNDCFNCVNLNKKSYCIFNTQYSKEEYLEKIKELHPTTAEMILKNKEKAEDFWKKFPQKYMHGVRTINSSGDYIVDTKNAKDCFIGFNIENCRFCSFVTGKLTDSYDFTNFGENSSLLYEAFQTGDQVSEARFSWWAISNIQNVDYCMFVGSSSDLFGCVGLRKHKYCILNKQYSKEKYFELREKIIEKMKVDGEYGEFFPINKSPFGYNETTAQEFFPLSKNEAIQKGYSWHDREEKNRETKEGVIYCEHDGKCNESCTTMFILHPFEIQFYKKMNLPQPSMCPNCRHADRIKYRNPLKLWHRKCMKEGCPNEFETSYSPDRSEIVYCEKCYQQEVY